MSFQGPHSHMAHLATRVAVCDIRRCQLSNKTDFLKVPDSHIPKKYKFSGETEKVPKSYTGKVPLSYISRLIFRGNGIGPKQLHRGGPTQLHLKADFPGETGQAPNSYTEEVPPSYILDEFSGETEKVQDSYTGEGPT